MFALLVYLLAYFIAGAPTITSVEGWVVFGAVAITMALASAIAGSSPGVTFQMIPPEAYDEEEEDVGF